jgi:hypothetical protein
MRKALTLLFPVVFLAVLTIACAIPIPFPPPLPPDFALSIELTDEDTGEHITNAEVIATTGEYRTWLLEFPDAPGRYAGAYFSGDYTIVIKGAGYQEETLEGIEVREVVKGGYPGFEAAFIAVELQATE